MSTAKRALTIFAASHCNGCEAALRLAERVRARAPDWRVEVVLTDAPDAQIPDSVIGTPMYTWQGQTLFLGNPGEDELLALLAQIQTHDR